MDCQQHGEVAVARHHHPLVLLGRSRITRSEAVNKPISATWTTSWPASRNAPRPAATGWRRSAASRRRRQWQLALTHGSSRIRQRRQHILTLEIRVGDKHLVDRQTASEQPDHRAHGHPHPTDTRQTTHLARVDRDPLERHDEKLTLDHPRTRLPSGTSVRAHTGPARPCSCHGPTFSLMDSSNRSRGITDQGGSCHPGATERAPS
jgi:hypothetical protein